MIKLYGFGQNFGLSDVSPFVLKVDAYMRMSGIDFDLSSDFNDFKKAPKGKLPYIKDGDQVIADSFFIFNHLKEKYQAPLESEVTEEQKAISNLIIKSLDENFYWCIVYSRWMRDDTWPSIKEAFFGAMPVPLKFIVPVVARRGVKSALGKHGIGKHNDKEIMEIAENTLESLSTMLSDKNYFFGDSPSTLDAVVYAFVAQVTTIELNNPLIARARKYTNLVDFCNRIHKKYYAD